MHVFMQVVMHGCYARGHLLCTVCYARCRLLCTVCYARCRLLCTVCYARCRLLCTVCYARCRLLCRGSPTHACITNLPLPAAVSHSGLAKRVKLTLGGFRSAEPGLAQPWGPDSVRV